MNNKKQVTLYRVWSRWLDNTHQLATIDAEETDKLYKFPNPERWTDFRTQISKSDAARLGYAATPEDAWKAYAQHLNNQRAKLKEMLAAVEAELAQIPEGI